MCGISEKLGEREGNGEYASGNAQFAPAALKDGPAVLTLVAKLLPLRCQRKVRRVVPVLLSFFGIDHLKKMMLVMRSSSAEGIVAPQKYRTLFCPHLGFHNQPVRYAVMGSKICFVMRGF